MNIMSNVTILSLVLLSLSIIHHCQCSSTQENDVEVEDELTDVLNRLKKIKNDQYSLKKEYQDGEHFPLTSDERNAIVSSDIRAGECQAQPVVLTASSGTIKSPGYDQKTYPNNANCRWIIRAPAGKVISATFGELGLSHECGYDSVTLYDGSSTSSSSLGQFCSLPALTVATSGRALLVVFRSDARDNKGKFSLDWTFSSIADLGTEAVACSSVGGPAKLTTSTGTIKSPAYDSSRYPNDARCQWLIEAPAGKTIAVTFSKLSLEAHDTCVYDSVTLYDGSSTSSAQLGKFCTEASSAISSTGSSVLVFFQTDEVVNTGRFSLTWTFIGEACGKPAVEPSISLTRIVGGNEARPHSWPWQCRIIIGRYGCGGSVINPNYVLTAAHCFFDRRTKSRIPDSRITVRCGRHKKRATDPAEQKVTRVTSILHPRFNYVRGRKNYDIALIRLPTSLKINDNVKPVCLPSTRVPSGTKCVITGWGSTKGTSNNRVLQQAAVPVISREDCRKISRAFRVYVTTNMFCAGYTEGGKDACTGDSGGPLVCKQGDHWLQYGVTSFGWGCANPKKPGVYADVVSLLSWITETSGVKATARTDSEDDMQSTDGLSANLRYAAEKKLLLLLRQQFPEN